MSDTFTDTALAESLTRDRLAFYGYTPEQINAAEQITHESAGCVNEHPYGWVCTDENDKPRHPDRDELDRTAEFVAWLLDRLLAAGCCRPATGDTLTDSDREAEVVDRMATVFGWQHLARYSGQTSEWLNLTLGAMARAAMHADRRATEGHAAAIRRDQDERMVQALTETTAERNEARATEADLRARIEDLIYEAATANRHWRGHSFVTGVDLLAALSTESQPMTAPDAVIACQPAARCADPHTLRWYCMRGHADDDVPATPGVCPLVKCERKGANR